jgi:tetratricopeptide (TPR) repeat protein
VNKGYIHVRHLLTPLDTVKILQLLHFTSRRQGPKEASALALENAVDSFAAHLQDKTLPAHTSASIHLLSIYKETRRFEKGKELWSWLIRQDEDYVDLGVYGAAIELLAYAGESLERSEELYNQALTRFPDNFIEYHLSPEAIVPDRGQPMVLPIPMTLLQGILTARVLAGDWRNAYLALDTALRLIPDLTPSRFFGILINERPVSEAVRVFQLACRAKVRLSPTLLTTLISRMRDAANENVQDANAHVLVENLRIAMTVLDLVRMHAGVSGQFFGQHFSTIITKCLLPLVYWYPDDRPIRQHQALFNRDVTILARELLDLYLPQDGLGVISAYNSLITLAGHARDADTVVYAIKRITDTQRGPDDVTCRALIGAAAMCGNPEGLWQKAWRTMVEYTEEKKQEVEEQHWKVLATSMCYLPGPEGIAFLEGEMKKYGLNEKLRSTIRVLATKSRRRISPTVGEEIEFQPFSELMRRVLNLTKEQMIDFDEDGLLTPFCVSPTLGSAEDLRTIYDELTTDHTQPSPIHVDSSDLGSMTADREATELTPIPTSVIDASGLPYSEHRFQNWVATTELLVMAERHERSYELHIDHAIRKIKPVSDADGGKNRRSAAVEKFGTDTRPLQWLEPESDHLLDEESMKLVKGLELKELRGLVMRVRGRN